MTSKFQNIQHLGCRPVLLSKYLRIYVYFLSKTDKIRFAHYRIWRQIDIIGYFKRIYKSKFVSASFKFLFTFGAESISM